MISNNVVCATSKGPDQPAYTRRLIRGFASRLYSMTVKLLTELHLEFLSLKGDCMGASESTLVKVQIVGNYVSLLNHTRRMAENGFAPPPREFCRHILSCRELKAESFKRCLHSVLRGVSL